MIVGTERKVLKALKELERANRPHIIGRKLDFSSDYTAYVCDQLVKRGLLVKERLYYRLAEEGER